MPCILNAANEIAVACFLNKEVPFLGMSVIIEKCMSHIKYQATPLLDDYLNTDKQTRIFAKNLIQKMSLKAFQL